MCWSTLRPVMWGRLKAPLAEPGGACIERHIKEAATARSPLDGGQNGMSNRDRHRRVPKAFAARVIGEHASPCDTGRPIIDRPAPVRSITS